MYYFIILSLFIVATQGAVKNSTPSIKPTVLKPTTATKSKPSVKPVSKPTTKPVSKPSLKPVGKPTKKPTSSPHGKPTVKPKALPSRSTTPSQIPSYIPSTSAPSTTSVPSTTSAPTSNCNCDSFDTHGLGPSPILACYNQTKYFEYFGVYLGDNRTNIIIKNPNFPSYHVKSSTECDTYFNNAHPFDETGFAYMYESKVYSIFANDDFARTYQVFTCPSAAVGDVSYIASVACPSNLQFRRF